MSAIRKIEKPPDQKTEFVWAYLVVSSEQQVETLDYQRSWAQKHAEQNGWHISATFKDVSSGRDGVRSLLDSVLERLRNTPLSERPSRVLMTRLDRLGRGLGLEAIAALAELTRLHVIVHTRQDGDHDIVRASDVILPAMRIITGAIENEARRDKAKSVYDRKRASGLIAATKRPYGLQLEKGLDVPDAERARIVYKAFELAANGYGLAAIGSRISDIAPSHLYRNKREHRVNWDNTRVAKMLGSSAYRGTIVPDDLWDRVQSFRSQAPIIRTSSRNPWPLSGALTCECGRRLVGSARGRGQRVYRCNSKPTHGRIVTHNASYVEQQFADLLLKLTSSPQLRERYSRTPFADNETASLSQRIVELEDSYKKLDREKQRIWDLNSSGKLHDDDLQDRLMAIRIEKDALKRELYTVREKRAAMSAIDVQRANAEELFERASATWSRATVDEKKALAHRVATVLAGLTIQMDSVLRIGPPKTSIKPIKPQ